MPLNPVFVLLWLPAIVNAADTPQEPTKVDPSKGGVEITQPKRDDVIRGKFLEMKWIWSVYRQEPRIIRGEPVFNSGKEEMIRNMTTIPYTVYLQCVSENQKSDAREASKENMAKCGFDSVPLLLDRDQYLLDMRQDTPLTRAFLSNSVQFVNGPWGNVTNIWPKFQIPPTVKPGARVRLATEGIDLCGTCVDYPSSFVIYSDAFILYPNTTENNKSSATSNEYSLKLVGIISWLSAMFLLG